MMQVRTRITRKGQVTVPARIREVLGLKEGDRVVFTLEGEEVRLARSGSVVERTAGVFKSQRRALSAEQLRRAAERAIAEDVQERARST